MRRSIVLVGLMGAGKTSVGRRLAEMLGAPFFDSDNEIQTASAGMSIPEIFEKFGEEEFRRLERDVLRRLLSGTPCVLATGGGAFMQAETRAAISEAGVSVWLDVELDVLLSRVIGRPGRPLLEVDDPGAVLADLAAKRAPIYAQAAVTVRANGKQGHDDVAKAILDAVKIHDERPDAMPVFAPGEEPWSAKA